MTTDDPTRICSRHILNTILMSTRVRFVCLDNKVYHKHWGNKWIIYKILDDVPSNIEYIGLRKAILDEANIIHYMPIVQSQGLICTT